MTEINIEQAKQFIETGKEMLSVADFLHEGMKHDTVVEAVYCALKAALSGEAKTVEEALHIGSGEWYK